MMDLQPTLEGPRLRLRPLVAADFDELYAAASDPRIWELHPCSDRWKRPVFQEFFAAALASGGALAVTNRFTGAIVGTSRYYGYNESSGGSVSIGFTFLMRKLWGGDYNRELKTLMLDHAFKAAGLVEFHVGEHNMRSRRAMEKIGARMTGRVERFKPDGTPDPTVVFQIRPRR
jgi:RimJ/RimL family protein N-acetyltransferase